MTDAKKALMNYEQADMDGIIVKASRQAIHEVVDQLDAALARAERAEDMLEEARQEIAFHIDHHEMLGKLAQHTVINEVGKDGRNTRRGIRYVVQVESKCAAELDRQTVLQAEGRAAVRDDVTALNEKIREIRREMKRRRARKYPPT